MKKFVAGYYENQGTYRSFQPSLLCREWVIDDMEIISLLSRADRMLGRLDMYSDHIPNLNLFIGMHVIKEATKSSLIEGTRTNVEEVVTPAEGLSLDARDEQLEVHNYIKAMNEAVAKLSELPFSARLIKQTHARLLSGVRGEHKSPGEFRHSQNWIGGYSINDAAFVPPVHNSIAELISDLEHFAHESSLPDLIKIALIHYQFETIHPFLDGNGRIGRLMITLYLVSKGILKSPVLYLSDYLERNRREYYDYLSDVRLRGKISEWVKFFLRGVLEVSEQGVTTFTKILELQKSYEVAITTIKCKLSNATSLLHHLYKEPITTIDVVALTIGVSIGTASKLISEFVRVGILKELTGGKRNRMYSMHEYIQLFC